MRYANIKHNARTINSLGDQMQIIALDYLYETMGFKKEDIVYIDKNELNSYNGEPVVLPICFPLFDYYEGGLNNMFSSSIKPVFLGHTIFKSFLSSEELIFYKSYEPIGCRDERAYNTFTKYGIEAYLMGCMTACLPRREKMSSQKKVFIVDVSETVLEHIPQNIFENAEILSHFTEEKYNVKKIAEKRYSLYKEEGALVITSLLHCAIPCLAAGIPTIIVKDFFSYRFAWVEKLCRVYLREEYSKVEWKVNNVEYEDQKKLLIRSAKKRIMGNDAREELLKIHNYYMNRNKMDYVVDAFVSIENYLKKFWTDSTYPYEYSIWGLTQIAEETIFFIKNNYPNAVLKNVYDKYQDVNFYGIKTKKPQEILKSIDEIVIVTAQNAKQEALSFFESIDKKIGTYVFAEILK